VGVIVLVILLLMLLPLPLQYSTTLQSSVVSPSYSQIGAANCISISGSWSTTNGGSVTFIVVDNSGGTVYSSDASSGSFSMNASNQPYMVAAMSLFPETVQVSGTCWGPLIQVGLP
jgi:hypothetical protein